jgi:acylphosphatase
MSGTDRSAAAPGEAVVAALVSIRGRVQGVGFRESMVAAARAAGATGWVRNCRDGGVEALVQGPAAAVDVTLAWAHRGPPLARVDGVVTVPVDVDSALRTFERRPTA